MQADLAALSAAMTGITEDSGGQALILPAQALELQPRRGELVTQSLGRLNGFNDEVEIGLSDYGCRAINAEVFDFSHRFFPVAVWTVVRA